MDARIIVVAVDGSPSSERALEAAIEHAALASARIALVHSLDVARLIALAGDYVIQSPDLVELTRKDGERLLASAMQRVRDAKLDVEGSVLEGAPVDEILSFARAKNAWMLTLGTHGRTGLGRLFLGSVAEGVLRSATLPVLVVRDPRS